VPSAENAVVTLSFTFVFRGASAYGNWLENGQIGNAGFPAGSSDKRTDKRKSARLLSAALVSTELVGTGFFSQ
jgi:hypothetical protein